MSLSMMMVLVVMAGCVSIDGKLLQPWLALPRQFLELEWKIGGRVAIRYVVAKGNKIV